MPKILLLNARKWQSQDSKPGSQLLTASLRKGKREQVLRAGCKVSNQRKGPKRRRCVGAERGREDAER